MQPKDLEKAFRVLLYFILENKEIVDKFSLEKSKSYDYSQSKGNNAGSKKERLKLFFGALIIFTVLTSFITLVVITIIF